jgi:hypothetical protein
MLRKLLRRLKAKDGNRESIKTNKIGYSERKPYSETEKVLEWSRKNIIKNKSIYSLKNNNNNLGNPPSQTPI